MKLGVKLFFIALILFSGVHIIHAQSVCGNAPDGKPWCAVTLGSGRDAGVPQSNYFSGTASESPQCEAFCGRDDIDCIAGPDEPECRLGLTGAGPFSSQASGTDDPEVAQSCIDINSSCRGTSGADNCTSKEVPDGSGETPCDYFTANLLSADQNYCGVDFTGQECWRYCFANYDNYVTDQVVCRPTQLECLLEADEKDADQLGQIVCGVNNPESDVDNGVKGNQTLFLLGTGVDSAFQLNGFKPFQDFRQSDDDPGLYSDTEFGPFINRFLSFTIGIAGAVVVVMIVVGGFTYVVSAAGSEKTKGKEIIKNSLIGLVLLLGSVALLNTINPQLLNLQALRPISVTITQEEFDRNQFQSGPLIGGGGGTTTGGSGCNSSGTEGTACHPSQIGPTDTFPADQLEIAAGVCRAASRGDPNLASGVDKCTDGNPFSFGLYQINIIANHDVLGCADSDEMFQITGRGTQGTCLDRTSGGTCIEFNCRVRNQGLYEECKDKVFDYNTHMQAAKQIYDRQGWQAWGAYNRNCPA